MAKVRIESCSCGPCQEWVIPINETQRLRFMPWSGFMILEVIDNSGLWLPSEITILKNEPSLKKFGTIISRILISEKDGN